MDEIDVLNETELPQTRRQVRSGSYEARTGPQPPGFPLETFRANLKAALMEDTELTGLGKGLEDEEEHHASVIGVAVDGPIATDPEIVYRVRMEFGDGKIDHRRIREIISDNVRAELRLLAMAG